MAAPVDILEQFARNPAALEEAAPLIAKYLKSLITQSSEQLTVCLTEVGGARALPYKAVTTRCHVLKRDGNDRPCTEELADLVANQALTYSIPRSELATALHEAQRTGNYTRLSRLDTQARSLFTPNPQTGEGGEMLMYMLIEAYLGAPQLLCKMSLKTNSNVHYHGADGIHAKIDPESRNLCIYWGESKLYQDVSSGIREGLTNLSPYLLNSDVAGERPHFDLNLVRSHLDLNNTEIETLLMHYLDRSGQWRLRRETRGVCLVGFDETNYPNPANVDDASAMAQEMSDSLSSWDQTIGKQITANGLQDCCVEVFCIPFPSVASFRAAFLKGLGRA